MEIYLYSLTTERYYSTILTRKYWCVEVHQKDHSSSLLERERS
ncbi:unnamed protein product [Brassica napus]|uniref:(rape) hypothetical protein n=1 Tax=Brassica napus TaxID=3708 RepID=A0A816M8E1_BRANA|nr:unnamed protein product [Brassica napus]